MCNFLLSFSFFRPLSSLRDPFHTFSLFHSQAPSKGSVRRSSLSFFDPQELPCRGNRIAFFLLRRQRRHSKDAFGLRERERAPAYRTRPHSIALMRSFSNSTRESNRNSPLSRCPMLCYSRLQRWMSASRPSSSLTANYHCDGRHSTLKQNQNDNQR